MRRIEKEEVYLTEQQYRELEQHGYAMPVYLGRGATSQVWRVWDSSNQIYAACKISRREKRAEEEAALLESLTHPVFPKYRNAWSGKEDYFLVMEYVPGSSLRRLVCRRGPFAWKQAVHIAMELAEGLVYLHERSQPVLFRDIKPDNCIIRQDGRVKLIDVGCACLEGGALSMAGSRGYSAPEQFLQDNCPGVESDVYALGRLLFFMLTGQEGKNIWCKSRVAGKRKSRRDNLWKGTPYGLRRLVEEASCSERRQRLPDMRSFLQRLSVYDGNHPLMRRKEDWRAWLHRKGPDDFYYVLNQRRGMD